MKKHRFADSRFFRAFVFSVAIFACAVGVAAQTATFTVQNHPILGDSIITADLNGDGRLDLAGSGAQRASVMLGNGDGTFQPKVDYAVGGWAEDLAAGDFNGDGKKDLVVGINTPEIGLSLLTGNGDGTFNAPVNFPNTWGADSPSIIAVDLNSDSRLDIVIAHNMSCYNACTVARTISVMLGNGDGTFQPTREIEVGTGMSRVAASDFNRDGIKDLVVAAGKNAQVYTLLGLGDGTFVQQPTMGMVVDDASPATDVDVADFNGDAIQDLVVGINLNASATAIALGNGDGTFGASTVYPEPRLRVPQYQAVADYNGDGKLDLAIAVGNATDALMEMRNGNGDGTFGPLTLYLGSTVVTSTGGGSIISGDFNADGKPDIALTVTGSRPGLDILINSTGTPAPPPVTLSSVTLNPSSVTGGSSSTGTVTLSARAQTTTVVQLSSNRTTATLPTSVTIVAGASSASFNINTTQVSATTSTTITATLNNTSRSASLTINPSTPTVDTVSITRAEYDSAKRALRVEATSTRATATLQAFVTSSGALIGTLTNNGGGRFSGQFTLSTNPQSITVRSNSGGQATRAVTAK